MGLVRNIEVNTATVGNVGGGLDPLHSFSLPANSLRSDGDYLNVWCGGDYSNNDNDKRVVFNFGGNVYQDTGLRDLDASVGWTFSARITRLSATSVVTSSLFGANAIGTNSAEILVGFGTGSTFLGGNTVITGLANLNSNATIMLVQGEATADDDVIQNLSIIELVQN